MYSRCLLLSLPAAPLTFPPHNKRAPLNALYGVVVGVLESCHLIGSEDFAIPQSHYSCFTTYSPSYRSGFISILGTGLSSLHGSCKSTFNPLIALFLRKGNVFTSMCQEFCPWVWAWQGSMCGGGVCMGACVVGEGGSMHGRRDSHCSGWYTSYWNAFLLFIVVLSTLGIDICVMG